MNWLNLRKLAVGAVVGVSSLFAGAVADAGWYSSGGSYGSWGSSGGYYGGSWGSSGGSSGGYSGGSSGGWASSGGSSGGWGSSGGSSGGWRMRHHHHRRHHSSGGYGSWGSSGGSSGGSYSGWGSSGGSSGGYSGGSSGGSSGGYQVYDAAPSTMVPPADGYVPPTMTPGPVDATTPPPPPAAPGAPAPGTSTRLDRTSAALTVSVPVEAKIMVNGRDTKATGALRRYVSRGLQPGYNYTYEIKAEVVRNGETLTETKSITVGAGETANVDFAFEATAQDPVAQVPVKTTLILRVPADAKVFLAGRETASKGEVREFATTKLADGATWAQYPVRVEIEVDGRTVTHEETVSLAAGESREVTIDLGSTQLASTAAATR